MKRQSALMVLICSSERGEGGRPWGFGAAASSAMSGVDTAIPAGEAGGFANARDGGGGGTDHDETNGDDEHDNLPSRSSQMLDR
jgi:hypothetical protein